MPHKNQKNDRPMFGIGRTIIGGFIAGAIAFLGQILVSGTLKNGIDTAVLEAVVSSIRSLCTSIVTASATILAVMLTMLSISKETTKTLDSNFFRGVKRIGLLSVISLTGSTLLLLFLSVPLTETSDASYLSHEVIYYSLISLSAIVTGVIITVALMLFNSLQTLITLLQPEENR